MKAIKFMSILLGSVFLFGCASGAKMEAMVYADGKKQYDQKLENSLQVGSVSGGQETNPAWTSEISSDAFGGALKASLMEQGLFSETGRYQLSAKMLKVDQPVFGLDLTVTTHVKYTLTDISDGSVLLEETIVAPHTATISDAFAAVKRLRIANEGAGKKNIEGILDKLAELNIDDVSLSASN